MVGFPLSTLFLDCDSFFASVEQQLRPELRGRPVGVLPVLTPTTCCIAASYEAKRHGVRTGTGAREARALCPDIVFVQSRPGAYLDMHHRVLEAVRTVAEIRGVHSIDELSCRTPTSLRTVPLARALATEVKRAVRAGAGEFVRCSVGVGPNPLLAKMAAEMRKPDGLVALGPDDLPGALLSLPIDSVPGIGRRMAPRLQSAGIDSMATLLSQSEDQMAALWGGVIGRRMWMWLHGQDPPLPPVVTRSVGHQRVLPPVLRDGERARAVVLRLLVKATMRAMHLRLVPQRLRVSLALEAREQEYPKGGGWGAGGWAADAPLPHGCADFPALLTLASALWDTRPPGRARRVGVDLGDLLHPGSVTGSLFEQERRGEGITRAMYAVNARHGRNSLLPASTLDAKDETPGGIAFHCVPDATFFDGPRSHAGGARSEGM